MLDSKPEHRNLGSGRDARRGYGAKGYTGHVTGVFQALKAAALLDVAKGGFLYYFGQQEMDSLCY